MLSQREWREGGKHGSREKEAFASFRVSNKQSRRRSQPSGHRSEPADPSRPVQTHTRRNTCPRQCVPSHPFGMDAACFHKAKLLNNPVEPATLDVSAHTRLLFFAHPSFQNLKLPSAVRHELYASRAGDARTRVCPTHGVKTTRPRFLLFRDAELRDPAGACARKCM